MEKEKASTTSAASPASGTKTDPPAVVDPVVAAAALFTKDLKTVLDALHRTAEERELRFLKPALRGLVSLRGRLTATNLTEALEANLIGTALVVLSSFVSDPARQAAEGVSAQFLSSENAVLPEVRAYLHLLVVLFLIDQKSPHSVACAACLLEYIGLHNNHTFDPLAAKAFYFFGIASELNGSLTQIRTQLIAAHRTACLKHHDHSQAVLVNLILRSLLVDKLYEQADKFVSRTTFPETANNNESARYNFYVGSIKAVQLKYDAAFENFSQALRKAPQTTADGFKIKVHKMLTVVKLLNGEIPERSGLKEGPYSTSLLPYFEVTSQVRVGNLVGFRAVTEKWKSTFKKDNTYILILRLHHNVIKSCLRQINKAYSRISFEDVRARLGLDTIEDAEFVLAKAIRDEVIDATIDLKRGCLQRKETPDLYSTNEPQLLFAERISFCLKMHNSAVLAMSYPAEKKKVVVPEDDPDAILIDEVIEHFDDVDDGGDGF